MEKLSPVERARVKLEKKLKGMESEEQKVDYVRELEGRKRLEVLRVEDPERWEEVERERQRGKGVVEGRREEWLRSEREREKSVEGRKERKNEFEMEMKRLKRELKLAEYSMLGMEVGGQDVAREDATEVEKRE